MRSPEEPKPASALEPHGGWPGTLGLVASGNDLSMANAEAAMSVILSGGATEAQIAGLIVGLRLKGETTEEIAGLATAMMEAAEPLVVPAEAIDIVGTGGSPHRRKHALNVSTMACFVAAAAGAVVCKHGNFKASSTSGSFDFLAALGIRTDLLPSQLEQCVVETGLGFALAKTFHPAMRHAGPVRAELGIPTVFNVLGPLANPGRVTRQVIGCSNVELAERMASVSQMLGARRVWIVSGHQELDELTTTGPSVVFDVQPGGIRRFQVDPADLGIALAASMEEFAGGSAETNATIFEAILDGSERGPRRDIVGLNAAAGLLVGGVVADLADGLDAAFAAIDDGSAAAKLKTVRAFASGAVAGLST